MPRNDREVFDYLTSDAETPPQSDFLAYAIFAHEKREWIKLFEERNEGTSPTQSDIDGWIANITEWQFLNMRSAANAFFVEAAEAYFDDRLKDEREKILTSAIVLQVKAAGSFAKQLSIALITAILVPLILGGIIALTLLYEHGMFSAGSLADRIHESTQQIHPSHPTSSVTPPH